MWQTDTVTIQTVTEVNNYGSITQTWTDTANTIACDVQDINKEMVFKDYGFTDSGEYKKVFDRTQSTLWSVDNQVKYNNTQWWVKLVNNSLGKIGASNHVLVILSKVI